MIIYTDGATSNNGYQDAVGGWAYVIINETENIMAQDSGRINEATNNICELTALINACKTADIYKTNFIVTIAFILMFSFVSIIPVINILCLLDAFTEQSYEAIYAVISQQTKERQI